MLPLSLALLIACGGADVPLAPPPDLAPEAPAPAPAPEPQAAAVLLYESLTIFAGDVVHGARLWSDGRVERGSGTLADPTWTPARMIGEESVRTAEVLLSEEIVRQLPRDLPVVGEIPPKAPRSQWRVLSDGTLRTIRSSSSLAIRVPTFERLDVVLRSGRVSAHVRSRFAVHLPEREGVWELACDASQAAPTRGIFQALMDPEAPTVGPVDRPELLRIDTFANRTGRHVRVLEGGYVERVDESGKRTFARLPAGTLTKVTEALDRLPWDDLNEACHS